MQTDMPLYTRARPSSSLLSDIVAYTLHSVVIDLSNRLIINLNATTVSEDMHLTRIIRACNRIKHTPFFPIHHQINLNYSPLCTGLVIEMKLGSKHRIIMKCSGKLPKAEINRVLNYTVAAVVSLLHV
jgi:hypothetical protein